MRRFWMTMPVALAALALVFGCSGNTAEDASQADTPKADETAMAETDSHAGHDHAADEEAAGGAEAEMASVTLSGTLGCGHCSYHMTESCAPAMKTADGVVYLIEGGEKQQELMDNRLDNPEVKIAGRVTEVDGQKVIYTDSVEMF